MSKLSRHLPCRIQVNGNAAGLVVEGNCVGTHDTRPHQEQCPGLMRVLCGRELVVDFHRLVEFGWLHILE